MRPEHLKRLIPLAFALVMGALAVGLANRWVTQQRRQLDVERQKMMAAYRPPIDVVVASKDIPEHTTLEPSFLKMAAIPENFAQPYAVRRAGDLVGKVTVAPIANGEQVLSNKVRRREEAPAVSTLSGLTPKGKRAVTIIVDTITGVGGFVRPGDLVDILWTLGLPQAGQKEPQVVTLTVFQDVPVLAVGGDTESPSAARSAAKSAKSGAAESAQYLVTLALPPQEISFLLFAREQGRIQLSLRPKAEGGTQPVTPANINTLLEMQLGIKPMADAPPPVKPTRQVEVYKGLTRDVVSLPEQEE
ncbi:MAG: Flp pilus assembly protein CpaB [Candidatus Omnitrophota bacterium]|nr:Flp pilus assembly protein CpaB [Candidatus Omnitrophota bacterium]